MYNDQIKVISLSPNMFFFLPIIENMKNPNNKAKTNTRTVTWLAIPLLDIYIQRKWHHCIREIPALPCLYT